MLDPTSVVEGLKVGYGGSLDVVIQGYVGFEHVGIRGGGVQRMLDPTSVEEGLKVGYGGLGVCR